MLNVIDAEKFILVINSKHKVLLADLGLVRVEQSPVLFFLKPFELLTEGDETFVIRFGLDKLHSYKYEEFVVGKAFSRVYGLHGDKWESVQLMFDGIEIPTEAFTQREGFNMDGPNYIYAPPPIRVEGLSEYFKDKS